MTDQLTAKEVNQLIHVIRGKQAMLDRELVELYVVETGVLNQTVARNSERFPVNFMF